MTRTMYDSVTPGNIPANANMVAGYVDGLYANLGAMASRFPHAVRVSIAVHWTTRAQVLDVEDGDATPAQAVQWCTQTMADKSNHELTVYCNMSVWSTVRAAFRSAGVTEPNYWVARYDNDPTIPVGAIAKQYQGDTHGYDVSSVAAYWPGVDPKPANAEIYPGANTSHWYSTAYPGDSMQVNTIVWHSTETLVLPAYSGGSIAPNLTAVPDFANRRLVWWQHFGFDESSRALVHDKTQIGTNTLNCAQVEIVGTCDPATHAAWVAAGKPHLYMPELPDWAIRDLRTFAHWANSAHDVPLTSGLTWKPYPQSRDTDNGVRMTNAQWSAFNGHCGHMHVPQNDHGDPGAFPISAILAAQPAPEDDMPAWNDGTVVPGPQPTVALVPHGNAWQTAANRRLHLGMDQLSATPPKASVRVAIHNGTAWRISTVNLTAAAGTVDVQMTADDVKVSLQTTDAGVAYAIESW